MYKLQFVHDVIRDQNEALVRVWCTASDLLDFKERDSQFKELQDVVRASISYERTRSAQHRFIAVSTAEKLMALPYVVRVETRTNRMDCVAMEDESA